MKRRMHNNIIIRGTINYYLTAMRTQTRGYTAFATVVAAAAAAVAVAVGTS